MRCEFPDGSEYYGDVSGDGQAHGHGEFTDADGSRYVGEFCDGAFEGAGTQFYLDGHAEASRYLAGEPVGTGVGWTADRAQAYRIVEAQDGVVDRIEMSLEAARALADGLGVPVPLAPGGAQVAPGRFNGGILLTP